MWHCALISVKKSILKIPINILFKAVIWATIFIGSASSDTLAQESEWAPNPKLFGDTIDVHIFDKDPDIFISKNQDILADEEGYIWISTFYDGLYRLDMNNPISFKQNKPAGYSFDQLRVNKIYTFSDKLYFASERGFLTYDHNKELFHRYGKNNLAKLSAYKSHVNCLAFLSQDTVILGGKYGLSLFDIKSDKIIEHLWETDPPKDGSSTVNFVHQIKVDPIDKNTVWAVGRKGLIKLNLKTKERTYFTVPDSLGNELKINYMIDFEIVGDHIYVVYLGRQKNQSIKGNQIAKFNRSTKEWKIIVDLLPKDKYGEIHVAEIQTLQKYGKYLFLASRGFGVQLIDTETDSLIQTYLRHPHYKIPNEWKDPTRLLDNYAVSFYTATIDKNGYLWAVSDREDIVRSKEPLFINKLEKPKQKINLNTLYVNGIKHRKQSFQDSTHRTKYVLNESERNVAFNMAVINPIYENIKYEYKHNSDAWKPALDNSLAQISGLSPGNNYVKVKATVNNEIIDQKEYTFYTAPKIYERWWFIAGMLSIILFIIYQFYRQKIKSIQKEERIKTSFTKQIAEMEMEVLRAQMNPHFLFNSLNSIKHYTLNKDKGEASQYITVFSQLLRQILQNSNAKYVSLAQELKAIKLYVEVEQKRFEHEFKYEVNIDSLINEDTVFIPPMILQPFIENAIWHGILMKEGHGLIKLIVTVKEHIVVFEITDNGIGREAAGKITKLKAGYSKESLGTKITSNRLNLAEEIYGVKTKLEVTDLYNNEGKASGTRVLVHMPRIYTGSHKK